MANDKLTWKTDNMVGRAMIKDANAYMARLLLLNKQQTKSKKGESYE